MKIEATGPNGERFEASGAGWSGGHGIEADARNRADRAAMQEALETWCKAFGLPQDTQIVVPEGASHE